MKLEYGTTTLGDDSTGDKILDLGGGHARQFQQEPLAGGTTPYLTARGNAINQRSFSVDKVHDSVADAVEWWNIHPDELSGSGTLRVTQDSFAAEMSAVLVSVERVELTGKTTILRYTFTGGPLIAAV